MRLLKVPGKPGDELPQLVDFTPDQIPLYAILSHRWLSPASEEISFDDLANGRQDAVRAKQGYQKLIYSCTQARDDGLEYVWIDTCCIDKSSSAELSEAINSMFAWYQQSTVCYAYLADVSFIDQYGNWPELQTSTWATRGWTLQELLAPRNVVFYSGQWRKIGTKSSLKRTLSVMTGINQIYLAMEKPIVRASIAERMSWAARRQTTRPEDIAYCLLGLFDVNLPMLYGEGAKAFIRLQEEIMKNSDDHTLFAWIDDTADSSAHYGLLAKHPRCFARSGAIIPYEDRGQRRPYELTNRGLRIELQLSKIEPEVDTYAAALDCPLPPYFPDSKFLAIYLRKLPYTTEQYARVRVDSFCEVAARSEATPSVLQTVFVRQSVITTNVEGIFPTHVFQLRNITSNTEHYQYLRAIRRNAAPYTQPQVHARGLGVDYTFNGKPMNLKGSVTCTISNRSGTQALFAIQITYKSAYSLLIKLGVMESQVGFDVVLNQGVTSIETAQKRLEEKFHASKFGSTLIRGNSQVCVTSEPVVSQGAKYYMIDVDLKALPESNKGRADTSLFSAPELPGFSASDRDSMGSIARVVKPAEDKKSVRQILLQPFGLKR